MDKEDKSSWNKLVVSGLLLAGAVAALAGRPGLTLFGWYTDRAYRDGLAYFLTGGAASLVVVYLLFPLVGARLQQAIRRLESDLLDTPPPASDRWLLHRQGQRLQHLGRQILRRNLAVALFGGLLGSALAESGQGDPMLRAVLLGLGWAAACGLADALGALSWARPKEDG